ncbi:MAG: hypothetical protein KGH62_04780, partial [Candidatus Micrarchaeota archaeon]|nr:hypothetical protein [Candidatus Micrarchaeota archaeon]
MVRAISDGIQKGRDGTYGSRDLADEKGSDALIGILESMVGAETASTQRYESIRSKETRGANGLYTVNNAGMIFESTGKSAAIGILAYRVGDRAESLRVLDAIGLSVPRTSNGMLSSMPASANVEGQVEDNALVGILAYVLGDKEMASRQLQCILSGSEIGENGMRLESEAYRGQDIFDEVISTYIKLETNALIGVLAGLLGDTALAKRQMELIEKGTPKGKSGLYQSTNSRGKIETAAANAAVGMLMTTLR